MDDNKDKKDEKKDEKKDFFEEFNNWGKKDDNNNFKFEGKNKYTLIVGILLLITFGFIFFSSGSPNRSEVPYSTFIQELELGNIQSVNIVGQKKVEFDTYSNAKYATQMPLYDNNLMDNLKAKNIVVKGEDEQISILYIVIQLLPWIIFGFIMFSLYKQTGGGGGGRLMGGLGKSNAKQYKDNGKRVTFDDVAGQIESKFELQEVVDFLKAPERFVKIGAKIPKGILLVGPPGTGKTLLARAVAGEAGVSFFHTSASEFVEMFVGMGAARVRDLFETARKNSPAIIFIDELDAVGRARGAGVGGGHDEREQTLNQILVEIDGFSSDPGVIVIAATNRPDVLDKALLRPGRFDRQVVVDLPDVNERHDILKIHAKRIKLDSDVELHRIARATPGTSGADLANIVNEAALLAARGAREIVNMQDFELARDKALLGVARKSRYMTDAEKRATAYHEAGHALLHYYLENSDPLHKVTIIPHGRALGLTISLPEKENYTLTKGFLEDRIIICMGGYVAEELFYGGNTTGVSNDIKQATDIARRMVTEWGMSSLGFISLASEDEPIFLGREIAQHKDFSETTAGLIDKEVKLILDNCMARCRQILTDHKDQLETMTNELCIKETIDDADLRILLGFDPLEVKED